MDDICSGSAYYLRPAAVAVEYHDGRRETVTFDTRLEAEQWLGLLPWRQAAGDAEVVGIGAAQLVAVAVLRTEDIAAAISWN